MNHTRNPAGSRLVGGQDLMITDALGAATGRGVLVAVIDSGWDRRLRDPRVRRGVGLVDSMDELALQYTEDDHDRHGHGTMCARLVLTVAPNAEILPIRVFGHRLEASVSQLQAALRLVMEHSISVVNMSLATLREDVVAPLYAACEEVCHRGTIIVAAAEGSTQSGYPAVFANAIGARAGDPAGAWDVQYDASAAIECVVPGTPFEPGGMANAPASFASNSFAAARLAGVMALFREDHPQADVAEARRWLAANASPVLSR